MIHGTLAVSHNEPGLRVQIDIRGPDVHILADDATWAAPAGDVDVHAVTPTSFRLRFDGDEFIFQPDDPLRARFALERDIAAASDTPTKLFRRRSRGTSKPTESSVTVRRSSVDLTVEIEAMTPIDDDPVFITPPIAPPPTAEFLASHGVRTDETQGEGGLEIEARRPQHEQPTLPTQAAARPVTDDEPTSAPNTGTGEESEQAPGFRTRTLPTHRDIFDNDDEFIEAPQRGGTLRGSALTEPTTQPRRVGAPAQATRAGATVLFGHVKAWVAKLVTVLGVTAGWTARATRHLGTVAARWLRTAIGIARTLATRTADMVRRLRSDVGATTLPASTTRCADGHDWATMQHGPIAVARCSRCGAVSLAERESPSAPRPTADDSESALPSTAAPDTVVPPATG